MPRPAQPSLAARLLLSAVGALVAGGVMGGLDYLVGDRGQVNVSQPVPIMVAVFVVLLVTSNRWARREP